MNNNILECNCIKDSAKSIMLSLLDRTDKMESDISSILLLISQGNLLNVGISSIILTVVSAENGGTNVVTITKTDGTLSTFQFKNGDKGDAFVYSNFTQEQISNLQKPATDAAAAINSMLTEEQFVMSATAFIMCAWWGVSASPTPTAEGQYWWDGAALHVSSAVVNAQGVITGYTWNAFDLSASAVYIDSTTSAAYKYKDGAMVALTNSVAIIASQLRGINEVLSKINN